MIGKSLDLLGLSFFRGCEALEDYLGGESRLESLFSLRIHPPQETFKLFMFDCQSLNVKKD